MFSVLLLISSHYGVATLLLVFVCLLVFLWFVLGFNSCLSFRFQLLAPPLFSSHTTKRLKPFSSSPPPPPQVRGLQQAAPWYSGDPRQQGPGGGPAPPVPAPRQLPLGETLLRRRAREEAGVSGQGGREGQQRGPRDAHGEPAVAVLASLLWERLVGILHVQVLPAGQVADREAARR